MSRLSEKFTDANFRSAVMSLEGRDDDGRTITVAADGTVISRS